jgi:hypothetical protein
MKKRVLTKKDNHPGGWYTITGMEQGMEWGMDFMLI